MGFDNSDQEDKSMMPLTLAGSDEHIIKKIGGSSEIRSHLSDLGFVPGGKVTVNDSDNKA